MSDLIERLREGKTQGSHLRWAVTDIHREAADAIAAKDREIAELRLSVQTVGDQLGAEIDRLLREKAETRQRTIEECAKVASSATYTAYMHWDPETPLRRNVEHRDAIAAAIRSLGKEGSQS